MKTTFPPAPFPRQGVTTARLARSFTLRRARGGPSPGAVLVSSAVGCPLPQGRPKARAAKNMESRRDEYPSPLSLGKGSGERQP